jgi:murein DD-endopeptidase MepM/ murein hydrolase activator NlpD
VVKVRIVATGQSSPPVVRFRDKTFSTWSDGNGDWLGLVAVGRDAKAGVSRMVVVSGGDTAHALASAPVTVVAGDFKVQRLNVDERTVTLSEEDLKRAAVERVDIVAAINTQTDERYWRTPFTLPVTGPISGSFGSRRVYNGKPGGYHSGLDIAAPKGKPVKSSSEGRVVFVGELFYTGNSVFIDHGLGLVTGYYHLDTVAVDVGAVVDGAAVIGTIGSTGRSTGPHLHWSTYLEGVKVDPPSLVRITSALGGETP